MYSFVAHDGPRAFLERAESWLLEREALHNLMLGLAYARAAPGAHVEPLATFATVERDGTIVGCVMRTPPHKVLITDLPTEAAPVVAGALAERYETIPAVLGPEEPAVAIATEWVGRRGGRWVHGMSQRLYRLQGVIPPAETSGTLRLAMPADVELAMTWGGGFTRDTGMPFFVERASVERWIADERLVIWDVDGRPCSIAVVTGRTPNGVRIGYVYTPPQDRRRGYASACVAALSQRMLDEGRDFCVLYTDLGNPTSNAIYTALGYEPIQDVRDIDIVPSEGET